MKASFLSKSAYALTLLLLIFSNCTNPPEKKNDTKSANTEVEPTYEMTVGNYAGAISNGMKGDSIFFTISKDGKKLEELTYKGYWRCSGKLEYTTVGPDGSFEVKNGIVNGTLVEPPDGGGTAWRFELNTVISQSKATGFFRMNINNLGCDTYKLEFIAEPR